MSLRKERYSLPLFTLELWQLTERWELWTGMQWALAAQEEKSSVTWHAAKRISGIAYSCPCNSHCHPGGFCWFPTTYNELGTVPSLLALILPQQSWLRQVLLNLYLRKMQVSSYTKITGRRLFVLWSVTAMYHSQAASCTVSEITVGTSWWNQCFPLLQLRMKTPNGAKFCLVEFIVVLLLDWHGWRMHL